MTKTHRWMISAHRQAEACVLKLPWARGLRRQAFIANRAAALKSQRPAA